MHKADLSHDNPALQAKLERLYGLARVRTIDMGFRPPFIDLLAAMGNPHENLPPVIHVAGTNGKGSVVAILESLMQAHGKTVHRYTSPHLKKFNERIKLAGSHITDHDLEPLIDEVVSLNRNRDITFFEITTAMAFQKFAQVPADLLLLEVGLGGRLDCTNITPIQNVAIINRISRDHCDILGNSLKEITREKAGIIKSSAPVIIGPQSTEFKDCGAADIIRDACAVHDATPHFYGDTWDIDSSGSQMNFRIFDETLKLPLPNLNGQYQIMNAGTALAALHMIPHLVTPSRDAMTRGLQNISWPGRLQKLSRNDFAHEFPAFEIYFDGGHNDSAGEVLAHEAKIWQKDNRPLHLILGMKGDKNPRDFLAPLVPYIASITVIPLRGVGPCLTKTSIQAVIPDINIRAADHIHDALKSLKAANTGHESQNARILITGSLYLGEQIL